jgi:uncharacterized protein (DUF885 family)
VKPILLTIGIIAALCLQACSSDSKQAVSPVAPTSSVAPQQATQSLDSLYQQAAQILFQSRTMGATQYGLTVEEVGGYYADRLDDYSPASEQKLRAAMRAVQGQISSYPMGEGSTEAQRLNRDILANITQYYAGSNEFSIGYIDSWMGLSAFPVTQINGPLIDIPRYMQSAQVINTAKDAEDYIARLAAFKDMVASVQAKVHADAEQGWVAPRVVLEGALRNFDRFLSTEPAQHPLLETFAEKLALVDAIPAADKQRYIQLAEDNIGEFVYPAYRKVAEQTRRMLDEASAYAGVWAQPKGEEFYRNAIRILGDSDLSADEIHAIGLSEVERISAEMDAILRAQGYAEGTVGARMVALGEEERFLYEDSDAGRAQLLEDLNGYIEDIVVRMQPLFKTRPDYEVVVKAYPVELQDGMPGGEYNSPSVDGSKPGIYWINLRDMKANPRFSLKSLTYHEANPGHHWQIALNLEQDEFPFLRRISPYNAYAEGWALYAERVAAELGVYEEDPFGDLGRLQAELFRAVRLVVDTGMHHKRWTREQAIEYMSSITGNAESDVIAEIERYMAWPGQALGYKMGMLKILELRAKAEAALGDKFDLAAYHDLLLLGGAMPMTSLEKEVDRWVLAQQ